MATRDLPSEITSIEAELGLDPSGASATVAARLSALDTTVAAKAGLVGNTFTGRQVVTAGQSLNLQAKTGTYAITTADAVVTCSGTFTVTLPDATTCTGQAFTIRNIATATITVARTSAQTIDAAAANVSIAGKGVLSVVSDGAGWLVTNGHYTDETVGRRIFTWSPALRGFQMTYGDTGWRSVSALLEVGASAGDWLMRRLNNKVAHMVYNATNTSGAIYAAPVGFRGKTGTDGMAVAVSKADGTVGGAILNTPSTGAIWFAPVGMKAYAGAYYNFEYTTDNAWPASLPGTASGSIPSA